MKYKIITDIRNDLELEWKDRLRAYVKAYPYADTEEYLLAVCEKVIKAVNTFVIASNADDDLALKNIMMYADIALDNIRNDDNEDPDTEIFYKLLLFRRSWSGYMLNWILRSYYENNNNGDMI